MGRWDEVPGLVPAVKLRCRPELYASWGISRLTVAVRARTVDEVRDEVARLGEELVLPTAAL